MITKIFEIRDRGTFIPVLATRLVSQGGVENYYVHQRCGYPELFQPAVMLTKLADGTTANHPGGWEQDHRTMTVAHRYIIDNFNILETGDVVDVRYLLGERNAPAPSERHEIEQTA